MVNSKQHAAPSWQNQTLLLSLHPQKVSRALFAKAAVEGLREWGGAGTTPCIVHQAMTSAFLMKAVTECIVGGDISH